MAVSSIIHQPAGVLVTRTDSTRQFGLGQIALGDYGGMFVYCSFGATIAEGAVVAISKDYAASAASSSSALGGPVGVVRAQAAVNGTWGWVQVEGQGNVLAAASVSANVALATTSTAGTAGASASTQRNLPGIVLNAASGGGGLTEASITAPTVGTVIP